MGAGGLARILEPSDATEWEPATEDGLSPASCSRAVRMARRTREVVEVCVDAGGDGGATTEPSGCRDREDGRSAGYVVMDSDESTTDVRVSEVLAVLVDLELANADSFDFFTGLAERTGCRLDFEV
jgi:hypothetical protein